MTTTARRLIILVILAIAAYATFHYLSREKPLAVIVHTVEAGRVESTVANTRAGTVKACRRARMAPQTGGQIAHMYVHEGENVAANQALIGLWNDDLAAQVKLAESEANASRAMAEQACLVADNAEREAKRQEKLQARSLTSDENVDRAQTTAKAQRASCQAAMASANVSQDRIKVANALLERTILRAPFSGTVAEINGELGEFATPSPTGVQTLPAVDLVDNSCLYISAPIDEVDAPGIRPGMDARISLDAFPNRTFPGIVQRISPYVLEVEKQARTVDIETVFSNPADFAQMLPGYSADAEVILETHPEVLRIPTEAILEGERVYIYQPASGILDERKIQRGLSNWKFTEVTAGLQVGEQVVTSIDREGLRAGAVVTPEQAASGSR